MPPDTPETILADVLVPAAALLPPRMDTFGARGLLLAICGQEAAFKHRRQIGGPARGLWQFERGGGVKGVLTHKASQTQAVNVCETCGVKPSTEAVYQALEHDDILAACFARLLLWTDPKPIPVLFKNSTKDAMWDYYKRNWRPGKPHPDRWPANYAKAMDAVFPID